MLIASTPNFRGLAILNRFHVCASVSLAEKKCKYSKIL